MDNPHAKKIFDQTLQAGETLYRQLADLLEVAFLLESKYNFGLPEWARNMAPDPQSGKGALEDAPLPAEHLADLQSEPTTRHHPDFPIDAPFEDQLIFALRQEGGTGSTKEVHSKYVELGGSAAEKTYRQARYTFDTYLEPQGRVIREEPGPSAVNNYWRLPDVPPREPSERRVAGTHARRTGGPTLREWILSRFKEIGKVRESGGMRQEVIRYGDLDVQPDTVSKVMSRMASKGELWRAKYGDGANVYGLPEWAEEGSDPERGFKREYLTEELRRSADLQRNNPGLPLDPWGEPDQHHSFR